MARAMHLDVDEVRRLDHWCRSLRSTFPQELGVLLVGSATSRPDYRDVDIRVVLPNSVHEALAASIDVLDLNMLLTMWGRSATGLRIDCQVQSFAENEAHEGTRYARGLL